MTTEELTAKTINRVLQAMAQEARKGNERGLDGGNAGINIAFALLSKNGGEEFDTVIFDPDTRFPETKHELAQNIVRNTLQDLKDYNDDWAGERHVERIKKRREVGLSFRVARAGLEVLGPEFVQMLPTKNVGIER